MVTQPETKETLWPELTSGFLRLEQILREEDGANLLPGVVAINRALASVHPGSPEAEPALDEVRSIYRTLLNSKGLLSDFFLWRDDFAERQAANGHLEDLKGKLGRLLASALEARPR